MVILLQQKNFSTNVIYFVVGSYRSRGPERAVAGRQLAVYSRGALQRKGGRGGEEEEEEE